MMTHETFSSGLSDGIQQANELEFSVANVTFIHETAQHKIYHAICNGRRFVLKTVNSQNKSVDWLVHLLHREFQILQQLDNPFIVRAWQIRDVPNLGLCLIMEYVDGIPLDEYLKTNPSKRQRKHILYELLDALSYIHSKQIIHGDIKPQNILITRNGNHVKLIDFGVASKDEYVAHNIGCTNRYAAPEQKGTIASRIDERTDIYALGYIITQLFPRRYSLISHKCQRLNPEKRYACANDVKHAISSSVWHSLLIICSIGIIVMCVFCIHYRLVTTPKITGTITDTTSISPSTHNTYISNCQATAITPISTNNTQENDSIMSMIHSTYENLYALYVDSVTHMPHQYQDFGNVFIHSFAQTMFEMHSEYKTQYQYFADRIEADYIVQYGIYYPLLTTRIAELPELWASYQNGDLSELEYKYLHQLIKP